MIRLVWKILFFFVFCFFCFFVFFVFFGLFGFFGFFVFFVFFVFLVLGLIWINPRQIQHFMRTTYCKSHHTQPDSFTRTAVCLEGYFSKRCYILLKGILCVTVYIYS